MCLIRTTVRHSDIVQVSRSFATAPETLIQPLSENSLTPRDMTLIRIDLRNLTLSYNEDRHNQHLESNE